MGADEFYIIDRDIFKFSIQDNRSPDLLKLTVLLQMLEWTYWN